MLNFVKCVFLLLLKWSCGFCLCWWVVIVDMLLIDLHMLNHPCDSGMNGTLSSRVSFFFFFFFLSFLRATTAAHGSAQARGPIGAVCHWPTPQPQPHQIQAASVTHTTAYGNAGSSTHWARPVIEPATPRFLVRFISAAPRWKLQTFFFFFFF